MSKKWIQGVVKKIKKGAFSAGAKRKHESTSSYANEILSNPKASSTLKKRATLAKTFAKMRSLKRSRGR